jgi:hypothetical protein
VHALATQAPTPLVLLQLVPHTPQFAKLLVVSVSQPSRAVLSVLQLPRPALQLVIVHDPAEQLPTPFALLHEVPHAPQLPNEVFRFTSQPSRIALSVSQLPKPALQLVMVHRPATQAPAPFVLLQLVPHAPQLPNEVFRFTSHPFSAMFPSQFAKPAWHVYWHAPSAHPVAVVFAGAVAAQLVAQLPQCRMSVLRFDSQPLLPTFCRSPLQSP